MLEFIMALLFGKTAILRFLCLSSSFERRLYECLSPVLNRFERNKQKRTLNSKFVIKNDWTNSSIFTNSPIFSETISDLTRDEEERLGICPKEEQNFLDFFNICVSDENVLLYLVNFIKSKTSGNEDGENKLLEKIFNNKHNEKETLDGFEEDFSTIFKKDFYDINNLKTLNEISKILISMFLGGNSYSYPSFIRNLEGTFVDINYVINGVVFLEEEFVLRTEFKHYFFIKNLFNQSPLYTFIKRNYFDLYSLVCITNKLSTREFNFVKAYDIYSVPTLKTLFFPVIWIGEGGGNMPINTLLLNDLERGLNACCEESVVLERKTHSFKPNEVKFFKPLGTIFKMDYGAFDSMNSFIYTSSGDATAGGVSKNLYAIWNDFNFTEAIMVASPDDQMSERLSSRDKGGLLTGDVIIQKPNLDNGTIESRVPTFLDLDKYKIRKEYFINYERLLILSNMPKRVDGSWLLTVPNVWITSRKKGERELFHPLFIADPFLINGVLHYFLLFTKSFVVNYKDMSVLTHKEFCEKSGLNSIDDLKLSATHPFIEFIRR